MFTYRLSTKEDVPAMMALWQESTDWGQLSPALIERLAQSPSGPPVTCVAVDDETGKIEGRLTCFRSRVLVDGREAPACRLAASVLSKTAKRVGFAPYDHPIARMTEFMVRTMRDEGRQVLYMKPDPRWVPMLRLSPELSIGTFPLWSLKLPLAAEFEIDPDCTIVCPVTGWGERVDALWRKAAVKLGCAVIRDSATLRFRANLPGTGALEIQRDGELAALVVGHCPQGFQWMIFDLLAVDEKAQRAALQAVCNLAHRQSFSDIFPDKIVKTAILATPELQPVLRELGFERDQYNFPLVVRVLDGAISREQVEPSRWYVTAND